MICLLCLYQLYLLGHPHHRTCLLYLNTSWSNIKSLEPERKSLCFERIHHFRGTKCVKNELCPLLNEILTYLSLSLLHRLIARVWSIFLGCLPAICGIQPYYYQADSIPIQLVLPHLREIGGDDEIGVITTSLLLLVSLWPWSIIIKSPCRHRACGRN